MSPASVREALRGHRLMLHRRLHRHVFWTRCWDGEERCLYRHNRMTYAFDRWIDGQWVNDSAAYWSVVSDTGYMASRRRARAIRNGLTTGNPVPCRHAGEPRCW